MNCVSPRLDACYEVVGDVVGFTEDTEGEMLG